MFTWQKHQHSYFQNYSFQTHLCLTWILVNEIEEILLICLIAFIYINWHIDVGRLYNFKQFDLEKNNCYKGRFEEGVTEKLNINHSSIRKTDTILCCLQNLIIGYCCTEGKRVLHTKKGDTELIQICSVGNCHRLKAGEAKGKFWILRTKKLKGQVLLFRAWTFENWA